MARRTGTLGTSVLDLDVDESKLSSGLAAGEKKAQGFLSRLVAGVKNLGSSLKGGIAQGLGIGAGLGSLQLAGDAIGRVTDFLGDAVSAASNLGETVSKVGMIFGKEAVPALEKWAETAAEAFGQSKQQALDAVSTFAIFGKSAGLAGDDLIGFSQELTVLASDFASFFNTSPEDAITAIGAALRGESEPIRRYGVLLDEATLRQRALKLGIIDTISKALTPQQRVLAAQAEILAQSSDAQGDFLRTSDQLANSQRKLEARFADVQVEIGEALLPVMLDLTTLVVDDVIPAVLDVTRAVKEAKPVWEGFGFVVGRLADGLNLLAAPFRLIGDGIGFVVEKITGEARRVPHVFKETGSRATAEMKAALLAGEKEIAAGAKGGITDPIWQAAYDAKQKAQQEAAGIPKAMGDAMLQREQDLTDSVAILLTFLETALTPAQERAAAIAFLTSQAYADALASGKPAAIARAQELANAANVVLYGAIADGTAAGTGLGKAWIAAMNAALDNGIGITAARVGAYSKMLRMAGSPDYTHATEAGLGVGKAWLDGVAKSLGNGKINLPTLPSIRMPTMPGLAGLAGVGMAGVGRGIGEGGGSTIIENHWHLSVGGVPYEFRNRDDFISALDDLSAFGGDGRIGR